MFIGKRPSEVSDIPQLLLRKLIGPADHGGVGNADVDDLKIVVRFGKFIPSELRISQNRRFGIQLRRYRPIPFSLNSMAYLTIIHVKGAAIFQ